MTATLLQSESEPSCAEKKTAAPLPISVSFSNLGGDSVTDATDVFEDSHTILDAKQWLRLTAVDGRLPAPQFMICYYQSNVVTDRTTLGELLLVRKSNFAEHGLGQQEDAGVLQAAAEGAAQGGLRRQLTLQLGFRPMKVLFVHGMGMHEPTYNEDTASILEALGEDRKLAQSFHPNPERYLLHLEQKSTPHPSGGQRSNKVDEQNEISPALELSFVQLYDTSSDNVANLTVGCEPPPRAKQIAAKQHISKSDLVIFCENGISSVLVTQSFASDLQKFVKEGGWFLHQGRDTDDVREGVSLFPDLLGGFGRQRPQHTAAKKKHALAKAVPNRSNADFERLFPIPRGSSDAKSDPAAVQGNFVCWRSELLALEHTFFSLSSGYGCPVASKAFGRGRVTNFGGLPNNIGGSSMMHGFPYTGKNCETPFAQAIAAHTLAAYREQQFEHVAATLPEKLFPKGVRVRLVGLKGRAELNGRIGVITGKGSAVGRVGVAVVRAECTVREVVGETKEKDESEDQKRDMQKTDIDQAGAAKGGIDMVGSPEKEALSCHVRNLQRACE